MIHSRTVSANCPALPRVMWPKYCSLYFVIETLIGNHIKIIRTVDCLNELEPQNTLLIFVDVQWFWSLMPAASSITQLSWAPAGIFGRGGKSNPSLSSLSLPSSFIHFPSFSSPSFLSTLPFLPPRSSPLKSSWSGPGSKLPQTSRVRGRASAVNAYCEPVKRAWLQ